MTNHYTIEVIKTQTFFKVTYRDNKFRKIEHLRGQLDGPMLLQLGRIIPRLEANVFAYSSLHESNVNYTLITQVKSQFTLFKDAWESFYEAFYQLPPKFTGAEGNALKGIITHLTRIGKSETEALALWQIILQKWHTLSDFHQQNADLKYINSKLNIILNAIKQQNNTYASGTNRGVEL
ncbi:MAG: hypothetical protein ACOH2D_11730 [Gelidibacter sp.]